MYIINITRKMFEIKHLNLLVTYIFYAQCMTQKSKAT